MTDSRDGALWSAYEYLAMAIGLAGLAILCLAWLPFAALLYPILPRRAGQRVGRFAIMAGFRVYLAYLRVFCACRFDLDALDELRDAAPLIVVANHPSLLDAVMILSRLPDAVCVIKSALRNNVLFGAAARLARYIHNDAPLEIILTARDELRRGAQLVIFPEGTRTVREPVNPCQASAGLIAQRAGTPIQALLIDMSSTYLGKRWPLFRPPELPLRCRIRLGRRFDPPADAAAFAGEIEAYFRAELSAAPALAA